MCTLRLCDMVFEYLLCLNDSLDEFSQHHCIAPFFGSVLPQLLSHVPIEFLRSTCAITKLIQRLVHFVLLEQCCLRIPEPDEGRQNLSVI